jgi:hypothetical protein
MDLQTTRKGVTERVESRLGSDWPTATLRREHQANLYFTVLTFTQHWPSRTNKSTGTMFPWKKLGIV